MTMPPPPPALADKSPTVPVPAVPTQSAGWPGESLPEAHRLPLLPAHELLLPILEPDFPMGTRP